MPNRNKQTTHIVNNDLYESLIEENDLLRQKLREVSAVGASIMFHTHRNDCNFTRDFLKSIVGITHEIEVRKVDSIYKDGLALASEPSVLEQLHFSRFNPVKS